MLPAGKISAIAMLLILSGNIGTAGEDARRKPDIYFVPTPNEVVEIMLRLADLRTDDVVYDLGCGDGRIVIAAARKAGCKAVGFDIDPEMVALSRANVAAAGLEHLVTIKEADIFELDLSHATVITLYLLPSLNVRLIPQLERLRPGSRIISHDFDMQGIQPDVEATVIFGPHDSMRRMVYLWNTPLRRINQQTPWRLLLDEEDPVEFDIELP